MDGLSAAPDGTSKWITSEEARRDVQVFRAEADAVMAGTGAVLADDPRLTARGDDDLPLPYDLQPLRVVVGETPIPDYYQVLDHVAPTLLVQNRDPKAVLQTLVERGIRHVWLEGGPRLAGAFWSAGFIDRVIGYIAPAMLGSGRAALEGEATTLTDLRPIHIDDLRRIGPDIRIIGTPGAVEHEEA
jgi:diaminohydroxyphosphoribosylaminopyrimidine deaminase/5-amino-6-(5-phosphoribosylamino)uracil reductase